MCPVCKRKLVETHHIFDFGVTCESIEQCPCGYAHEYAYGAEREHFGPFTAYTDRQRRLYRWLWQVWTFDGCAVTDAA